MTQYQNVLMAIDIYGGARDVLQRAVILMADGTAKLTVLNVVHHTAPLYGGSLGGAFCSVGNMVVDETETRKNVLSEMQELVQELCLPVHSLSVEFGRAADVILEQADKQNADLIVIGSHGRHGVGLLLGSTANAVLHRAKCDVLAVRIKESQCE